MFLNCTGGCGGGPRFVRKLLSVTGGGTWLLLLLMALLLLLLLLLLCFCFLSVSLAASSLAKSTGPPPPNRLMLLLLIVFSGDGDLLLVVAGDCAPLVPTGFSFGIDGKPSKIPPNFWPLLLPPSDGPRLTPAEAAPPEETLPWICGPLLSTVTVFFNLAPF